MTYTMKPLPFDPPTQTGLSERFILSHYENNYGGGRSHGLRCEGGGLCPCLHAEHPLGQRSKVLREHQAPVVAALPTR
jgi:hypothetical protein